MQVRRCIAVGAVTMAAASACLVASQSPATARHGGNHAAPRENGQPIDARARREGFRGPIDISVHLPRVSGPPKTCPDGQPGSWQRWGSEGWHETIDGQFGPPSRPAGTPGDAVAYNYFCPQMSGIDAPYLEIAWSANGEPVPTPSAADLIPPAWAYVKGLLEEPDLTLSPPEAESTVINLPTFVAIGNPQPPTTYYAQQQGVEVWIDVSPAVTLNPGEPGSPAIGCDHDGSTFVREAGSPEAQAEGECAHIYRHHGTWGGNVTITWTAAWRSNQAGQNGTLDAAPSVTDFDRQSDELQGVVTNPG